MQHKPFRIEVLGGLTVRCRDQIIERLATRKGAALLVWLVIYSDRAHPRDVLADLLWPSDSLDSGRNSLRVALADLNQRTKSVAAAEAPLFVADRLSVRVNISAVSCDLLEMRSLVAADGNGTPADRIERLKRAVALYRGPLAPHLTEEFLDAERLAAAAHYQSALRALVKSYAEQRDLPMAIHHAIAAVRAEPLLEESHRDLMRLYAASGQLSSALSQYAELERVLARDLNTVPSQLTRNLAAELQGRLGHGMPGYSSRSTPPGTADGGRPRRLPVQLTSFVGRAAELGMLDQLLMPTAGEVPCRLVTLTGVGGTGKSRLAIEALNRLESRFGGWVWFVALSDVRVPMDIVRTAAEQVCGATIGGSNPQERLEHALGAQRSLIVLDNLEQLAPDCAAVVAEMLQRIPSLQIIGTSRRVLGVHGEHELPLGPLTVPGSNITSQEQITAAAGIHLFLDRARAVRPTFTISAANAATIAELCRCLEGLPLSLELAAARIRIIDAEQMLGLLANRFTLLVDRHAEKDSRHRSLKAAIAWSFELLPPKLRTTFTRLSVFQGGFTLNACAKVCRIADPLDEIEQLTLNSLIQTEEYCDGIRYRMLESLRAFGEECMPPDDAVTTGRAHAHYFLEYAESCSARLMTAEQPEWLSRMDTDRENLQAAARWWIDTNPGSDEARRMVTALTWYFIIRSRTAEIRRWIELALRAAPPAQNAVPTRATIGATIALGMVACYQDDFTSARQPLEHARNMLAVNPDDRQMAAVSGFLGWVEFARGEFTAAVSLFTMALTQSGPNEDLWTIAATLNLLGFAACHAGDYSRAEDHFRLSKATFDRIGNVFARHHCTLGEARVNWLTGRTAESLRKYADCVTEFEACSDMRGLAYSIEGLGRIAAETGNLSTAAVWLAKAATNRACIALSMDAQDARVHLAAEALVQSGLSAAALHAAQEAASLVTPVDIAEAARALANKLST